MDTKKKTEINTETTEIRKFCDDVSIVLCGEAGKGIQTVEQILVRVLKLSGYHVFATKEYMSRIRGGSNSIQIRVSSDRIASPLERIDILIPMDSKAIDHLRDRISENTFILMDDSLLNRGNENLASPIIEITLSQSVSELGNAIYSNIISTGILASLLKVDIHVCEKVIRDRFKGKDKNIIDKNLLAVKKGYEISDNFINTKKLTIEIPKQPDVSNEILINGAEAIGLGAIAGGCNFISSYPMSPSTGVLVLLSNLARKFDIVAEQAEDEISAINMALGAWYAGARGMVTTSGGGFALMEEGISLSGMHELPVVVHLAQRPGPATGLPTRTEQGDLNLVLYAGHGEFPRAIFAPGTTREAFDRTRYAFDLADEFQIPVFILSDQYFIDSYYNIPGLPTEHIRKKNFIIETSGDYRRYEITDTGISPRGIPGFGTGLVCVDSDEHDIDGHLTENLEFRVQMQDKRLQKLKELKERAIAPTFLSTENPSTLVVCWGSTLHPMAEAVRHIGNPDLGVLHFQQVYPINEIAKDILVKTSRIIMVEGNSTSQFGTLLEMETKVPIQHRILKYNGLQFTVEELVRKISSILEEGAQ